MEKFDPVSTADRLKAQTKMIRKTSYKRTRSRLDRYKGELLTLRDQGCTAAELQRWLRAERRTKVALTTVTRWLAKHG